MFNVLGVGCGGMAKAWVEYALSRDDVKICGLVDILRENAVKMKDKHSLDCSVYTNIDQALSESGCNLVFDITIPDAHFDVTTKALAKGCHVFGEKPMSSELASAYKMVEAAGKSGKTYAIMQNRRFLKDIRAYRELLAEDVIGQIGIVNVDFYIGAHFGGFRDLMESPLVLDMAIHTFDQARFLSKADPVSVYCQEFNPSWSWYKGAASAVCIFEMSNGSVFTYRGSWCSEGCQTEWEGSWRIVGSNGTAIWNAKDIYAEIVPSDAEAKFIRDTKKVLPEYKWAGKEGHFGCLDSMFEAVINDKKPETDCTDNIKSIEMVFGAIESAKKGMKVRLG